MDPIAQRGFAVVLPRNNQLGLLYKAAQEQQANKQRQVEQIDKEFENIKLGMPTVRTELMGGLSQMFKDTYQSLNSIQRDAYSKGGLSSDHRSAKSELINNWNVQKGLVEAYNKDLDAVTEATNKNPDLFNKSVLVDKTKSILNDVFIKDDKGNVVGFNANKAPSELLNDPDIYNDNALAKTYIDDLGKISVDAKVDPYGSTSKQTFTANLFQVDPKSGQTKLDPNTGKPIPMASPESVLLWDSDPIRKAKLDKYAQSITKEGESWEKNRAKAFKQFVVDPFGNYEQDLTTKEPSEGAISRGEKQVNVDNRYKTLRKIIDNFDETALAQANNVMNGVQLEFAGGGSQGYMPGETIPDRIIIKKREQVDVQDPNNPFLTKKEWIWNRYEIPIRTDEQKEKALFEVNTILDEAGDKTGLKVGNDAIRSIHDKYKAKNKKQEITFPKPKGKSEADTFGLN